MDSIASLQSSASWSEIVPQSWIQESRSFQERGLTVAHEFQVASEVEVDGCTDNVLILSIGGNQRQVTRIDDCKYEGLNPPGAVMLLPAQAYTFCHWECNHAEEAVSFYIDPQRLQQIAAENDCLHPERIELRPVLHDHDAQLSAIATAFRSEMYSNDLGGKLYTESLANQFLIHVLRHYCTQTPILRACDAGLSRQQLQAAIDFIGDHLSGEFKLQDVAGLLGMSQYYFCRLFKQSMGIAPYQYVLQQRVDAAKRLLIRQPEKSIAEVALECGFSSQSQLTQHFRKLTGTTPKVYRRS